MRKIITRTIVSYVYNCNVANMEKQSLETIPVETTVILKHPERQLPKKMPGGYTFISTTGEPEIKQTKLYMELKDFIAAAKPYEKQDGDVEEA